MRGLVPRIPLRKADRAPPASPDRGYANPTTKVMMGIADLAINGSYSAYAYVVLLQISILYLQRPDLNRRLREKDQIPGASADFYPVATVSSVPASTGSAGCFQRMWRKNSA
jgi:hypothetical protein